MIILLALPITAFVSGTFYILGMDKAASISFLLLLIELLTLGVMSLIC